MSSLGRAYVEIHAEGQSFTAELTGEVDVAMAKIAKIASATFGTIETEAAAATAKVAGSATSAAESLGALGGAGARAGTETAAGMGRAAESVTGVVAATGRADAGLTGMGAAGARAGAETAAAAGTATAAVDKLAGASSRVGSALASLTGLSGKQLGGALGGFAAYEMVKSAGDLEQAVRRLVTTAGELPKNFGLIREGVLKMSGDVGIGAKELANGLYLIEQSGFHGRDGLTALRSAAQGAIQEQADLSKVTDALTTTLHDFNLGADQSPKIISQMIEAVSHGKISFESLTGAMHSIEPIAAKAGMSFAQTAGGLAAMTSSGMHADQAAQNLASSIRSFSKPTRPMIDELNQLGLSADDLSAHLGERGIAGTLHIVEDAILKHMDPATKRVLLPAFNQSKEAAADAKIMYDKLPPSLKKLADSYTAGTISQGEWRDAIKAMPAEQVTLANSWRALTDRADGFSQVLKSGSPATQTFIGALGKAVGTAEGLNVALQLTGVAGEHARDTIAAVAGAAAQADGNIAGWSEVQKNFNQRMREAWEGIKALGTSIGTELLPYATKAVTWFAEDGVSALRSFGQWLRNAIDTAAHSEALAAGLAGAATAGKLLWEAGKLLITVLTPLFHLAESGAQLFGHLPGPIQAVTLALAALKAASALGLFTGMAASESRVIGSLGKMTGSVATFGQNYRLQMALADESSGLVSRSAGAMAGSFERTFPTASAAVTGFAARTKLAMAEVGASFAQAKAAQQALTAENFGGGAVPKAIGDLKGLEAAASTAASKGLGVLKSAASGLMGLFGGPWGVALIGATAGIWAINAAVETHRKRVEDAEKSLVGYMQAQRQGGDAASEAGIKLGQYRSKMLDAEAGLRQLEASQRGAASTQEGYGQGVAIAGTRVEEQRQILARATAEYDKQRAAMTPLELAQERVTRYTNDLNAAYRDFGAGSPQTQAAADNLRRAQAGLAGETERTNNATKTEVQLMQEKANKALAAITSSLQLQQAQDELSSAIDTYNQHLKDGTSSQRELASEGRNLALQAQSVAQAAANAAVEQGKANGATDLGTISQGAMLESLQRAASQMTGPGRAAIEDMIKQLGGSTTAAQIAAGRIAQVGVTVLGLPGGKFINIDVPTGDQMRRLHDLGYATITLPNGKVVVTADTNPAMSEIQALINHARTQSILYRATLPDLNGSVSGSGRPGLASGGWVRGPGSTTSDSILGFDPRSGQATAWVSDREFVVNAAAAAAHAPLLEAINAGQLPRRATGGWINVPAGGYEAGSARLPVHLDGGDMASLNAAVDARFKKAAQQYAQAVASSAGGAARWAGTVQQALRMLGLPLSATAGVLNMINRESGGNPNAVNLSDSNARAGHPSRGLMQTIPGTFAAFRSPALPNNILDPLSNIYAGINYAYHRYGIGMLTAGGRRSATGAYLGYADGGLAVMRGNYASIVPPGTPRVIGDNMVSDEAYVPINGSARSKAIWTQAGIRMGTLRPGGGGAAASSGGLRPIEVSYSPVYQMPPTASAEEVAALVSVRLTRDLHLGLGDSLLGTGAGSALGVGS